NLDLNEEQALALAQALGAVDSEGENVLTTVQELSEAAKGFSEITGNLTDTTTAWDDALKSLNESLDEDADPIESLAELSNGMELWLESMREGRDTTRNMFGDMASIMEQHTGEMGADVGIAIEAVLAMGDAGPEAMAVLASASPEEFLEFLEMIRLNAALTSEAVQGSVDEMLSEAQRIIADGEPEVVGNMNTILEALVLTVGTQGDAVTDHISTMMNSVATYIEAGGELSVAEMEAVMSAVAYNAEMYGTLTSSEIETMMGLLVEYVANGGDIMGEDFAGAMAAMQLYAASGGELTVRELADALEVGIDRAREIGEAIGIDFTEGVDEGMNPAQNIEHYKTQFEAQYHVLNSMGYHAGVSINEFVQ
ncbi:MAG: hypothetical protein LC687_08195, partial [Actinobacteria bacterium]|nr:hypothetical protein [Actinomycetota bacterium]MCA1807809.1 hypothetical protein [Actinomycetota bacterium]